MSLKMSKSEREAFLADLEVEKEERRQRRERWDKA